MLDLLEAIVLWDKTQTQQQSNTKVAL